MGTSLGVECSEGNPLISTCSRILAGGRTIDGAVDCGGGGWSGCVAEVPRDCRSPNCIGIGA